MTEDPAHAPLTEAEQAYYNQLDEDVTAGRIPTIGRGTHRDGSRISDTDLDAILTKARTELATHPTPTITGDHCDPRVLGRPAISTTPTLTNIKTQGTWAVTLETDDPNDGVDDIWVSPIYADEPPTTYAQARDRYLTVAKDLNRVVPPDPEPTTGIRFWYTLETSASTPWYPDDINIDPTQAINQLYDQLTQ